MLLPTSVGGWVDGGSAHTTSNLRIFGLTPEVAPPLGHDDHAVVSRPSRGEDWAIEVVHNGNELLCTRVVTGIECRENRAERDRETSARVPGHRVSPFGMRTSERSERCQKATAATGRP